MCISLCCQGLALHLLSARSRFEGAGTIQEQRPIDTSALLRCLSWPHVAQQGHLNKIDGIVVGT